MTSREEVESAHTLLLAALKQLLADVLHGGARSARDGVWEKADERFCDFKAACAKHEAAQRVAQAEHILEPKWRSETRAALRGALSALSAMRNTDDTMTRLLARIELLLDEDLPR